MKYVFEQCVFDVSIDTIYRADQPIKLRLKVAETLHHLLKHRDRVVSKDELSEQIWPDVTATDETLESCISEVRRAVGDTGRTQRIIRTFRGRGYRFMASVEPHDHDGNAAESVDYKVLCSRAAALPINERRWLTRRASFGR